METTQQKDATPVPKDAQSPRRATEPIMPHVPPKLSTSPSVTHNTQHAQTSNVTSDLRAVKSEPAIIEFAANPSDDNTGSDSPDQCQIPPAHECTEPIPAAGDTQSASKSFIEKVTDTYEQAKSVLAGMTLEKD